MIPVPQSAFLGKPKAVAEEGQDGEDVEEEEEEEIDMDDMLGEGEDSEEEQESKPPKQEANGRKGAGMEFLVGLDAKTLSRYVATCIS